MTPIRAQAWSFARRIVDARPNGVLKKFRQNRVLLRRKQARRPRAPTGENSPDIANRAPPRVRYQLDNHLGSACTETDETGVVISHEEYHPYGTTALRALSTIAGYSGARRSGHDPRRS